MSKSNNAIVPNYGTSRPLSFSTIHGKAAGICIYTSVNVYKFICFLLSSLIAVSYEARERGVKKNSMRGDEAQKVCPDINLVQVPVSRGKADLTKWVLAPKLQYYNHVRYYPLF